MKAPKKAIEVRILADGFDWPSVIRMLKERVAVVEERREDAVGLRASGHGTGHATEVHLRDVTPEQFSDESIAWLEKQRTPDADPDDIRLNIERGGPWLGAARRWSRRYVGDYQRWSSTEPVSIPFVELWDLARVVAEAAIREERKERARETLELKERWRLERENDRLSSEFEATKKERDDFRSAFEQACETAQSGQWSLMQDVDGPTGMMKTMLDNMKRLLRK